jgi:Uncharacterized protein conserved in bacteria
VKLLIDNCVSHVLGATLRERGHEVECVADWPADPGDRLVLAHAARTGQVLITADREFGELVVFERLASAGIIVIDQNIRPPGHAEVCVRALTVYAAELAAGGVVIVTPDKMRARTPKPSA